MREIETILKDLAEAVLAIGVAKGRVEEEEPPFFCDDATSWRFRLNDKVLIRTVTFTYIGRVDGVSSSVVHLTEACWVADTGRFGRTLEEGKENISELEMFPNGVSIALGGIIDHSPWCHAFPTESTKDKD